tara:strand:- start:668 stop:1177 length:510 start_codon:yes stop_codon:yes gene_type:complete
MIFSKTKPEFLTRFDLFAIEYIGKYVSGFKRIGFIIPLSLLYSSRLAASLSLLSMGTVLLDCCIRDRGDKYIVVYDNYNIFDNYYYPIGYIEGRNNYITSWMIAPSYQKKGVGMKILKDYLKDNVKDRDTYHLKTSRLLDTFYMKDKLNIKNIMTNNYYNYTYECYLPN